MSSLKKNRDINLRRIFSNNQANGRFYKVFEEALARRQVGFEVFKLENEVPEINEYLIYNVLIFATGAESDKHRNLKLIMAQWLIGQGLEISSEGNTHIGKVDIRSKNGEYYIECGRTQISKATMFFRCYEESSKLLIVPYDKEIIVYKFFPGKYFCQYNNNYEKFFGHKPRRIF